MRDRVQEGTAQLLGLGDQAGIDFSVTEPLPVQHECYLPDKTIEKVSLLHGQSFGRADAIGMLDRTGKVARASGGTLFLDDVAALSPGLQRQLLRLIQDGEFEAGHGEPRGRGSCNLLNLIVAAATGKGK